MKKIFLALFFTIVAFSSIASSEPAIKKSCKGQLQDGKSSPETMSKICDCIAGSSGLTEYGGFVRLSDTLKKYRDLQAMADDFVKSPEDGKIFQATLDCSFKVGLE
ncbi:MAG: hypothetical protein ACOYK8_04525 [Alphaproteobacteria bacterium]